MKVLKTGKVNVRKPFEIEFLDSDDDMIKRTVKPGTYEYRLLDFRGWKPRQIKLDGEWFDCMNGCEEIEELLKESADVLKKSGKGRFKESVTAEDGTIIEPGVYYMELYSGNGFEWLKVKVGTEWHSVNDPKITKSLKDQLVSHRENIIIKKKQDVKGLPDGTIIKITGSGNHDGSYYVSQDFAPALVNTKNEKDRLYLNAKFDNRIQTMLRSGVKFEVISENLTETTTIANIAPTKDYMGTIEEPIVRWETNFDFADANIYDMGDNKMQPKEDDSWRSPLGKLIDGEPIRKAFGLE